jgi:hypothetical protein
MSVLFFVILISILPFRVILDRASTEMDDIFAALDFTVLDSAAVSHNNNQFLPEIKSDW